MFNSFLLLKKTQLSTAYEKQSRKSNIILNVAYTIYSQSVNDLYTHCKYVVGLTGNADHESELSHLVRQ